MTEASKVLADIIQTKLGLDISQIWIRNQNIDIPKDSKMYVSVGAVTSRVIGNNNSIVYRNDLSLETLPDGLGTDLNGSAYFDGDNAVLDGDTLTTISLTSNLTAILDVGTGTPLGDLRITLNDTNFDVTDIDFSLASDLSEIAGELNVLFSPNILVSEIGDTLVFESAGSGLFENQRVYFQESIQIDLWSRDNEARDRRYELLSSITSVYSAQKQEENGIRLLTIPTNFIDTSAIEGGSRITRYTIRLECTNIESNTTEISDSPSSGNLYTQYPVRVDDENSISESTGLIEFTID